MRKNRVRKYGLEFKQQAAILASEIGPKRAAEQLGVNVANIQRWKSEQVRSTDKHEPGQKKSAIAEEIKRLQRENDELRKVNHILKRAAAFFSQDHLK